jgi:hypothetical protein
MRRTVSNPVLCRGEHGIRKTIAPADLVDAFAAKTFHARQIVKLIKVQTQHI